MKPFNQTLLICCIIAFLLILISALGGGIVSAGILLFFGSPIVFIVGLIVTFSSDKESKGRQIGQGIMLSALIYLVVGFTTCSAGNLRI